MAEIQSVGDVFQIARKWEEKFFGPRNGFPPIWYRGQADAAWELQPTVLRSWFIDKIKNEPDCLVPEQVKLPTREKTINGQFRRMAASLLPRSSGIVDIYFLMQHHGFPTRLLDWTGSPLVGLFFAVATNHDKDGRLYVTNPRMLIPDPQNPVYPPDIVNLRHPLVEAVIKNLFGEGDRVENPFVVPVFPDLRAGRMLQQSSHFTLHMPPPVVPAGAGDPPEEPINTIPDTEVYTIPKAAKPELLVDLRRAGISWATLFPDLDNVCREIRTAWGLYP